MSDIQITLQLERRSGILAGVVASLHRNGLQFRSQRMRDGGAGGSLLAVEAEGELSETESLVVSLCGARGIAGVTELIVDGKNVFGAGQDVISEAPASEAPSRPEYDADTIGPPIEDVIAAPPAAASAEVDTEVPEDGDKVTLVDLSDDDDDELFPPPEPDPPANEPVRAAAADTPEREPVQKKPANTTTNLPAAAARRRRYNR